MGFKKGFEKVAVSERWVREGVLRGVARRAKKLTAPKTKEALKKIRQYSTLGSIRDSLSLGHLAPVPTNDMLNFRTNLRRVNKTTKNNPVEAGKALKRYYTKSGM